MPGFLHSVTTKMFRNSGELARSIAGLFVELPKRKLVASTAANDLSEPLPVEYRADQVMAYRRLGQEKPELAIVVEVQHKKDLRKAWTWMSYVANAAADHECPVVLLVVTWSARVAEWARGPFASGHPGFALAPLVVDLSELPTLLASAKDAQRIPELAVLCALANRDAPSAKAALEAILELPSDQSQLYWAAIARALSPSDLLIVERKMENLGADAKMLLRKMPRLTAKIGEPFEARGRRAGKAEGLRKGIEAMQDAVLKLLRKRLGKVSSSEEKLVRVLSDAQSLVALSAGLGAVDAPKAIREVLARHARQAAREINRG